MKILESNNISAAKRMPARAQRRPFSRIANVAIDSNLGLVCSGCYRIVQMAEDGF